MNTGGKGSARRPTQIADNDFTKNWESIFGKNKQEQDKKECQNNCDGCKCKQQNNTE